MAPARRTSRRRIAHHRPAARLSVSAGTGVQHRHVLPLATDEPGPTGTDLTAIYRDEPAVEWLRRARGALVAFHHGTDRAMNRPVTDGRRAGSGRRKRTWSYSMPSSTR